jgi:hypothetical protein
MFLAENKGASQAKDDDFPEDVVAYMDQGIKFALGAALPPAEEAAWWVFKENH